MLSGTTEGEEVVPELPMDGEEYAVGTSEVEEVVPELSMTDLEEVINAQVGAGGPGNVAVQTSVQEGLYNNAQDVAGVPGTVAIHNTNNAQVGAGGPRTVAVATHHLPPPPTRRLHPRRRPRCQQAKKRFQPKLEPILESNEELESDEKLARTTTVDIIHVYDEDDGYDDDIPQCHVVNMVAVNTHNDTELDSNLGGEVDPTQ